MFDIILKRNCVSFLFNQEQAKRRFGRFSLESLAHPIEAGFIFSLPHLLSHLPAFHRIVIAGQCLQGNIFRNK